MLQKIHIREVIEVLKAGEKYLITTDTWFIDPTGNQRWAAWGTVSISTAEDLLGFTPSRPSTNWYAIVGKGDKSIIIAGCRIHFVIQTEKRPTEKPGMYKPVDGKEIAINEIYFAE